ncbi:PH domain-containing protein [Occultella gossypii]|uniref:PH domain-containing protein n=1 Tax=Occultella gossypii TaxID=2800820 RepID=A0ABS7S2Z5_9MICO|nr:PH domain-containing protein [Occultella gossypii]MBZ2194715.1 PH domain-containing protein [Occultella gossypii]
MSATEEESPTPPGADGGPNPEDWHTLDPRTALVTAILLFAIFAGSSVLIVPPIWLQSDAGPAALAWCVAGTVLITVGSAVADHLRWRTTRYRLTDTRLEMHGGILFKRRRSLARERIRNVDLTANILLRAFGLVRLSVGTGEKVSESEGQSIVLDPISRAEGECLRTDLLRRAGAVAADPAAETALAVWSPRWVRYVPMSVFTLLIAAGAAGAVFQVAEWFGVPELPVEWARSLADRFGAWPALLGAIVVFVVAGAIGMTALGLESWWNYRLERGAGVLRVRRGLLTSRSTSFEESRVRGVELVEPLGIRLAGAARLDVLATGMRADAEKQEAATLVPGSPREVPLAVAERILGASLPTDLRPHPRAARDRRLFRAALVIVGLGAVVGVLVVAVRPTAFWTSVLIVAAVVGSVIAVAVAVDGARSLGHALTPDHLVARRGSVRRSTAALSRPGIIGWRIRQSVFQRRVGVLTVTATTAASRGRYSVVDVGSATGLDLADEAVPGLLRPFLEPVGADAEGVGARGD